MAKNLLLKSKLRFKYFQAFRPPAQTPTQYFVRFVSCASYVENLQSAIYMYIYMDGVNVFSDGQEARLAAAV